MGISFMTFASSDWIKSPVRYRHDLEEIQNSFGLFDNYYILNENNLDTEYHQRFSKYFTDHGFAYFSWKPKSILETLQKIDDGDVLFYLDSGCVLPMNNIYNFILDLKKFYENFIKDSGWLALTTYIDRNPNIKIPNISIVKKTILKEFNLLTNEHFLFQYPHWQAGLVMIKKTPKAL